MRRLGWVLYAPRSRSDLVDFKDSNTAFLRWGVWGEALYVESSYFYDSLWLGAIPKQKDKVSMDYATAGPAGPRNRTKWSWSDPSIRRRDADELSLPTDRPPWIAGQHVFDGVDSLSAACLALSVWSNLHGAAWIQEVDCINSGAYVCTRQITSSTGSGDSGVLFVRMHFLLEGEILACKEVMPCHGCNGQGMEQVCTGC